MDQNAPAPASVKQRASGWRWSTVWLVPVIAAVIALYLGWRSYSERGLIITVSFNTADGITAGQTQLRYKAVALGTVTSVRLNTDTQRVEVEARMSKDADAYLTDHTRFWVVRPRINSGSISGVETLISGAYIQCDPGEPGGERKTHFEGLEDAPGVRSDEPGKTYILQAERIGSIGTGSAVFFRDITVGEVLNYDIGDGFGPIKLTIFVRSPYDKLIRAGSRFWNASGVRAAFGPTGFRLELQSIQSVLSGGIDFATPEDEKTMKPAAENTVFPLFADQKAADASTIHERVPYVTYFQASVKNLDAGSPVVMYGIRIGTVTGVKLLVDAKSANARVRVNYEIEPEMASIGADAVPNPLDFTKRMVQKGLRAKLVSENLITGQKSVSFEFVPKAKAEAVAMEGNAILMPAGPAAGLDGITDAMADIAGKLNQIPFAQIGENLNNLLAHADQTIAGPDMQDALHSLSQTLAQLQGLVQKADQGLTPALEKLPQISADLQETVAHANGAIASLDQNSDFQRNAARTMEQVNDAARSIRLLADFLSRHPEAFITGRDNKEGQ